VNITAHDVDKSNNANQGDIGCAHELPEEEKGKEEAPISKLGLT